jgi:hypothetical protein
MSAGTSAYHASLARGRKRARGPTHYRAAKKQRSNGYTRRSGFYGRFAGTRNELKFFDSVASSTALAATGTVNSTSINLIDQGNGESQMIGRKVVIKSILLRANLVLPQSSNATLASVAGGDTYRIVMVLDKQANGAAPTVAALFEDTDIRTMNDLENSQRFTIIKEWKGSLNGEINHDGAIYFRGDKDRYIKWYKKCSIPIEFAPMGGGSRVIGEVKSNNVAILGFSASGTMSFTFRVRIRYSDA